jgi:phage gp16-like protein
MTAPARQIDTERRGLIGKIHVAKAQLRLDEDTYRDVLRRVTGKESAKDCSLSDLEAVKAEMVKLGWKPAARAHPRAGKRPLADGATAAKLRALWISGYHLGVVKDPAEAALATFVKRATGGKKRGVDALQWMTADDARKAIEALKAWLGRAGDVDWDARSNPRAAVIQAQGRILTKAFGNVAQLDIPQLLSLHSDLELDAIIEKLGDKVRRVMAGL